MNRINLAHAHVHGHTGDAHDHAIVPARAALHALVALAAYAALVSATGCSAAIPWVEYEEPEPPPALVITGDQDDLRYTIADDEDPLKEGLQITLRVDVHDEAVTRVDLELPSSNRMSDVVEEDLDGNRAAYFVAISFPTADAQLPLVARALEDTLEARATIETLAR